MELFCALCRENPCIYWCKADKTRLCLKCTDIHVSIDSYHDVTYILCDRCKSPLKKFRVSENRTILCLSCLKENSYEEKKIECDTGRGTLSNEIIGSLYKPKPWIPGNHCVSNDRNIIQVSSESIDDNKYFDLLKVSESYEEHNLECYVSNDRNIIQGVLFESIADNIQNFTINKWQINISCYEKLANVLSLQNEVIGVYGCEDKCLELLSSYLSASRLNKDISTLKEGIVFFYNKDSGRLGLYFKCRDPNIYINKPYPQESKELIFVRLLFDICGAVICCPSQEALRSRYPPKIEGEQNHSLELCEGVNIKPEGENVEVSDTEDAVVRVIEKINNRDESSIFLTNFHIFRIKKVFQDKNTETKKIDEAIQKLFKIISNTIESNGLYSFIESIDDASCFLTFKNTCERSLNDADGVCASIKNLYREVLDMITEIADNKFKQLADELNSKFKRKYKIERASLSRFNMKLKNLNQALKKFDFKSLKSKSKELKKCIRECFDPKKDSSKISLQFINNWNKDLESWYLQLTTRLTNDVLTKSRIIIHNSIDSKKKYIYSFETLKIIQTETEICIESTGIENKYMAEEDFINMEIISFSEDMAYLLLSNNFQTQIVQFNPTQNYASEISMVSVMENDLLIASGSTPNIFVAFQNSIKKAYFGAIQQKKYITKGTELKVYMHVKEVVSACILPKTPRVFLLNEVGRLFYMELLSYDKLLHPVKVMQANHSVDFIKSQSGERFLEIKCSDDETIYLLKTKMDIELYDINFNFLKRIRINSISAGFKCLTNKMFNTVITFDLEVRFEAHKILGERKSIELGQAIAKPKDIPEYPIIDVVHYSLAKFGKTVNLVNNEDSRKDFFIYYDQNNLEVDQYIRSIATIKESLSYQGVIYPGNYQKLEGISNRLQISKTDLSWIILTRQPLHLASIQEGNLMPLQNGLNNTENLIEELDSGNSFIGTFVNYIKLGHLENLISSASNLRVITIIGKQNSGKSYLINRIFGTRFDVAAHRCTDGIWLSLATLGGNLFLIIDSEGFFSAERTVQEEIKLFLFLSAIADVTILNQDLEFDKNLECLFDKLSLGIDRLRGSSLFKGRLEVALRDAGENQDKEILIEGLQSYIGHLISLGEADILFKLFSWGFTFSCYHNYENKKFDSVVEDSKLEYIQNVPILWKSGKDLLMTMKIVLAQIYADDCASVDERASQISIEALKNHFKEIINDPANSNHVLKSEVLLDCRLVFLGREIEICIRINSITLNTKEPLKPFIKILKKITSKEERKFYHNDWYSCIDVLIKSYFDVWRKEMLNYIYESLPQSTELMQSTNSEIVAIKRDIDKIVSQHYKCRRKCSQCERFCIKNLNHKSQCDCSTDHKCPFDCKVWEISKLCAYDAGHNGDHKCKEKKNPCMHKCRLFEICKEKCIESRNHLGEHKCGKLKHPCGKNCEMYAYCGRKCEIDCLKPHKLTIVDRKTAQFVGKEIEFPQEGQSRKQVHICNNEHVCGKKCERNNCEVEIKKSTRFFDNEYNRFTYLYTSQCFKTCACAIPIPKFKTSHTGAHDCKKHKCQEKCPDCDAYCNKEVGHEGLHSTPTHRNKEKCIYLSKAETFEYEDLTEGPSQKATRKFKAGEIAYPEFCDISCQRKGRGHSHPLKCPGGKRCYEKTKNGLAVHSKDIYYPDTHVEYDLLECSTYWQHHNWQPPIEAKNPKAQQSFSKCNAICGNAEHKDIVYCENKIYHSFSDKYADHNFPCRHYVPFDYDICFVLDRTGSMSDIFPEVKRIIKSVISQRMSRSVSTKFAIVGYTDHGESGGLDPMNPVTIYPPSGKLNNFDQEDSVQFLNRLIASGGGPELGEAMIDGIYNAYRLQWRPEASKIYFIIGDDCPQGRDFHINTKYPEGCPCGHNWRSLLKGIKSQGAIVKLVKLSEILNKTGALFKEEYGENMEMISLDKMTDLAEAVIPSIVRIIEHNLEFAKS